VPRTNNVAHVKHQRSPTSLWHGNIIMSPGESVRPGERKHRGAHWQPHIAIITAPVQSGASDSTVRGSVGISYQIGAPPQTALHAQGLRPGFPPTSNRRVAVALFHGVAILERKRDKAAVKGG